MKFDCQKLVKLLKDHGFEPVKNIYLDDEKTEVSLIDGLNLLNLFLALRNQFKTA